MTNTKQLTGAVALLASIAVLDSYIFVELEPGFESMVLIEPYDSPNEAETMTANESSEAQSEVKDFWIDLHKVSGADFAKFLDTTGYEPQKVAPNNWLALTTQNGDFAIIATRDKWGTQVSQENWNEPSDKSGLPMNHTLQGQDDLKVSFDDALAYCNWLGKELPTAEQSEHVSLEGQEKTVSGLIEFRCAKNI